MTKLSFCLFVWMSACTRFSFQFNYGIFHGFFTFFDNWQFVTHRAKKIHIQMKSGEKATISNVVYARIWALFLFEFVDLSNKRSTIHFSEITMTKKKVRGIHCDNNLTIIFFIFSRCTSLIIQWAGDCFPILLLFLCESEYYKLQSPSLMSCIHEVLLKLYDTLLYPIATAIHKKNCA